MVTRTVGTIRLELLHTLPIHHHNVGCIGNYGSTLIDSFAYKPKDALIITDHEGGKLFKA